MRGEATSHFSNSDFPAYDRAYIIGHIIVTRLFGFRDQFPRDTHGKQ